MKVRVNPESVGDDKKTTEHDRRKWSTRCIVIIIVISVAVVIAGGITAGLVSLMQSDPDSHTEQKGGIVMNSTTDIPHIETTEQKGGIVMNSTTDIPHIETTGRALMSDATDILHIGTADVDNEATVDLEFTSEPRALTQQPATQASLHECTRRHPSAADMNNVLTYRPYWGNVSVAANGATCVPWSGIGQISVVHELIGILSNFREHSWDTVSNNCRNAFRSPDGPGCYVNYTVYGFERCYNIPTCEEEMNDCEPNQCMNGATCVDLENRFECRCAPGYWGVLCQSNDCSDTVYEGSLAVTQFGWPCANWLQVFRFYNFTGDQYLVFFPDNTWEEIGNKCRNPDDPYAATYCMVFKSGIGLTSDLCGIPRCTDCFRPNPEEPHPITSFLPYMGDTALASTALPCQPWYDIYMEGLYNEGVAFLALFDLSRFPDDSWENLGSKCRDPMYNREAPWCFVDVNNTIEIRICGTIPVCRGEVNECEVNQCLNGGTCIDEDRSFACRCMPGYRGFICEEEDCWNPSLGHYFGSQSRSYSGKPCLMWSAVGMIYPEVNDLISQSLDDASNECRNVDEGSEIGCGVFAKVDGTTTITFEQCIVPYCTGMFECADGSSIPDTWMCDNIPDCAHGEDDSCELCHAGTCAADGRCIMEDWMCDGIADCESGDDENPEVCGGLCPTNEFACSSGECVAMELRCDFHDDCRDGTDEDHCMKLSSVGGMNVPLLYAGAEGNYVPVCQPQAMDDATAAFLCHSIGLGLSSSGEPSGFVGAAHVNNSRYGFVEIIAGDPNDYTTWGRQYTSASTPCEGNRVLTVNCAFDHCGTRHPDYHESLWHVVNGADARDGRWPWQVSLMDVTQSYNFCGGTLVDEYWVVTAAHCVDTAHINSVVLLFGSVNVGHGVAHRAAQIIVHPSWDGSNIGLGNDVALVRLEEPVEKTPYIRPACLPEAEHRFTRSNALECYLTGWGLTDIYGTEYLPTLQEARIELLDHEHCVNIYQTMFNHDDIFCVGSHPRYSSVCQGDSGGPLICRDKNNVWTLGGIASFVVAQGTIACAYGSFFTNVTSHVEWINMHMNNA